MFKEILDDSGEGEVDYKNKGINTGFQQPNPAEVLRNILNVFT